MIISGSDVWRNYPKRVTYERGIHDLANVVRDILIAAYFYGRWEERLAADGLAGMERELAIHSQQALFKELVLQESKLFDKKKDNWSLDQLLQKWQEVIDDRVRVKAVQSGMERLRQFLQADREFRNREVAHIGKQVSKHLRHLPNAENVIELTLPPQNFTYLQEIVDLLDMFVSTPIAYTFHMRDTREEYDLRHLLGLTTRDLSEQI